MTYGTALPPTEYEIDHKRPRSVIGSVEISLAGNVIVKVGKTVDEDGQWVKTEHVVLTPHEAIAFVTAILSTLFPEQED